METTTKNAKAVGMDAAKTTSERVVLKTTEVTRDLIGSKIADKITSAGKPKNKGKEEDNYTNKSQEIYVPPEKHQQIEKHKVGISKNYKPIRQHI